MTKEERDEILNAASQMGRRHKGKLEKPSELKHESSKRNAEKARQARIDKLKKKDQLL